MRLRTRIWCFYIAPIFHLLSHKKQKWCNCKLEFPWSSVMSLFEFEHATNFLHISPRSLDNSSNSVVSIVQCCFDIFSSITTVIIQSYPNITNEVNTQELNAPSLLDTWNKFWFELFERIINLVKSPVKLVLPYNKSQSEHDITRGQGSRSGQPIRVWE